jgi:glucose-1-phosphate adenylyltransferase
MKDTLVMLLAGGAGSRLSILGYARAKPAVPFAGCYRIIDFTLSNAINSGLNMIGVLTQYKPLSLMEHIGSGESWDLIGRTRGAKILPPRTGKQDSDWYKGTADAVRQNMDFIRTSRMKRVLILSGDHIYKMDYSEMMNFHQEQNADVTIGMMPVPWEETHHFGTANLDKEGRIIEWEEKPKKARSNLASMGIYVFDKDYLYDKLRSSEGHDFGKNIIPSALEHDRVFGFPFTGYWRDVGTLKAYWDANMDVLKPDSGLDIGAWRIRTKVEEEGRLADRPPAFLAPGSFVANSVISPGCFIEGKVENSILSPGVVVNKGAVVRDSVVMHNATIQNGAKVTYSILDKKVVVGEKAVLGDGDASIHNKENPEHLWSGLVVAGKWARIPDKCRVGKNVIIHPKTDQRDFKDLDVEDGETVFANHSED